MIAELVVSHNLNATAKDIYESIHPHPSLSESIWKQLQQPIMKHYI